MNLLSNSGITGSDDDLKEIDIFLNSEPIDFWHMMYCHIHLGLDLSRVQKFNNIQDVLFKITKLSTAGGLWYIICSLMKIILGYYNAHIYSTLFFPSWHYENLL